MLLSLSIHAQCPWNRVNCSHCCGRHTDENGDGYCDYSILELQVVKNVDSIKIQDIVNENKVDKKGNLITKEKDEKSKTLNKTIVNSYTKIIDSNKTATSQINTSLNTLPQNSIVSPSKSKPYDLILISFITSVLYGFTYLLAKLGKIKIKYHRRIWNVILLLTFTTSCLFGFFLVIQINYQFAFDWFKTILHWHVQVGISMTIIAIFHIFWHLKYLAKIFSK